MPNLYSSNLKNTLVLYTSLLIFGLLGFSSSSPLYDVYNTENEPAAIPMHFLKIPMQSNPNENNGLDYGNDDEVIRKVFKRTRNHLAAANSASSDSCCPTVIDIVEPSHGKNRSGHLVELYQSESVRQRFYENSCTASIADQPCRFLDRKHSHHSRCVQQYSYTYAMVKDMGNENAEWKLDYIQVRSGCSCHITNT